MSPDLVELEWKVADQTPSDELLETLLTQRGYHEGELRERFLNPQVARDCHDPHLLPGMEAALERLQWAIKWREKVVVFGDYDADGITATVLLKEALEELGARVSYLLPHRLHSGYGLNPKGVEQAKQEGAALIITVDNGTTAHEGAQKARELSVDLIITDHHQPGDELPPATAILNPNLTNSHYPFGGIAGVGVALKLAQALRGVVLGKDEPGHPTQSELELTALGTVADVSVMVDENRALVREGLKHIGATERPGLRELLVNCQPNGDVDTETVGFKLGPRLNAAGRMEAADVAVELLLEKDQARCVQLAQRLEVVNQQRRELTEDNTALAETLVQRKEEGPMAVVHHKALHPGVAGLVAGRLCERLGKPALVLTDRKDLLAGSARAPPGMDLTALLGECQDLLVTYGGHKGAAGVTLEPGQLKPLEERLHQLMAQASQEGTARPVLEVDSLVEGEMLVPALVRELDRMAPFGRKNPRPILGLPSAMLEKAITMGRQRNHLRLEVRAGGRKFKAVGWNMGAWRAHLTQGHALGLAFTLELEHWRGREGLQLNLKGLLSEPFI